MRRAITATLAALLFLLAASAASANQWYLQDGPSGHRHKLPIGEPNAVQTSGTWKLKLKLAVKRQLTATCVESGTALLTNVTTEAAVDEMTGARLACNEATVATLVAPPYSAELVSTCQPCKLVRSLALEVTVAGVDYGVFTGTQTGQIGDFDEPFKDDLDHTFKWDGTGEAMTNETGGTLKIGGQDNYGVEGDHADGEPNGGPFEEEHAGGGE